MRSSRSFAVVVIVAAAALAACGSPCQELANRICNCQSPMSTNPYDITGITSPRDTCQTSVSNQLATQTQRPGPADEEYCQQKLATCPDPDSGAATCQLLQTQAGKEACGLAYPAQ